ncbi:hypothetical protein [Ancylobacter sp.]|uniref:hypothetical protein n=1 Tax=Ancylobacter sp. TaxID=1872567 RepID=UPI003D0D1D4A
MADVVDAMAITLAQAAIDLTDEREAALVLLEAGYDEREIADHRHNAVRRAENARRVDRICAGAGGWRDVLELTSPAGPRVTADIIEARYQRLATLRPTIELADLERARDQALAELGLEAS